MKRNLKLSLILFLCFSSLIACKKELKQESAPQVPQSVINKVHQFGFSAQNIAVHEDGYLVEGDIIITDKELNAIPESQFLRIGEVEQYRTYNVVTGLPVTITVSISSRLSSHGAALNEALARYNTLGLRIRFQRVSLGADISLVKGNGSYLASAGFPTSAGEPYSQIKINANAIGSLTQPTVATIIAHELGHCIGFRHTDYMNRSYSCGGTPVNEGSSDVGAVFVPGTPTGPDPNSWMLACIGSGQNRPFTANDRTALNYIY